MPVYHRGRHDSILGQSIWNLQWASGTEQSVAPTTSVIPLRYRSTFIHIHPASISAQCWQAGGKFQVHYVTDFHTRGFCLSEWLTLKGAVGRILRSLKVALPDKKSPQSSLNLKFHCVHNSTPLAPILSQTNTVHTHKYYSCNSKYSTTMPATSCSSKWSLSFMLSNYVHFWSFACMLHVAPISQYMILSPYQYILHKKTYLKLYLKCFISVD